MWLLLLPDTVFDLFDSRAPAPAGGRAAGAAIFLYAFAYAHAARRIDGARPWVAIGLAAKLLGAAAWFHFVRSGSWHVRTFPLVVFHCLVWWLPFVLLLLDPTRLGARLRALAPRACAALNAAGALAMPLVLRHGLESTSDPAARADFVQGHLFLWRAGWAIWMCAGLALVAFFAWWGARIAEPRWAVLALAVSSAGLACDLTAESLLMTWFPERMGSLERAVGLLTGGLANGLYTVAGILLTLRTRSLRGPRLLWTWGVWIAGGFLTGSTLAGSVPATVASTAALMTLFCPWVWFVGRKIA
ncbi:MAG: hypothetical protein ACREIU_08775 [Planctomycetota bacterium]